MFGYGVKDDKLSESVVNIVYRYATLRLCKAKDLGITSPSYYAVERSTVHDRIAEALDCDRELVEEAFNKAADKVNCLLTENDVDFTNVFDSFCENLLEVALREDPKDRHPDHPQLLELPI